MKTILQKIGMLTAVLLCSLSAYAYDFEVDGIYYNVVSLQDLTCEVVAGDEKYSGDIVVPESIIYGGKNFTIIGVASSSFSLCEKLITVNLPESLNYIGSNAFYGCEKMQSCNIPFSITTLPSRCFASCRALQEVLIHKNIKEVGQEAFSYATIKNLIIEDSEESLVLFPTLVTKSYWGYLQVDRGAFYNCNISSLYLGRNIESEKRGLSPFFNCHELEEIVVGPEVTILQLRTFYWMEQNTYYLNYVTPITRMDYKNLDTLLTLVILPGNQDLKIDSNYWESRYPDNSDTEWGGSVYANDYCNVEKATIGRNLVLNCEMFRNLTNVIFTEEFNELGQNLLANCSELSEIEFPCSMEKISENAFKGSSKISEIVCKSTTPPSFFGDPSFSNNTYINGKLKVPLEAIDAYKQAEVWKNFWNIVEMDEVNSVSIEIEDVVTDIIAITNLYGLPVDDSYKGAVIIRYSDGTAKKVLQK